MWALIKYTLHIVILFYYRQRQQITFIRATHSDAGNSEETGQNNQLFHLPWLKIVLCVQTYVQVPQCLSHIFNIL